MKMNDLAFRCATEQDVPLIFEFIKGLAIYEKMEDEVVATEEILREWIFEKNRAEVIFVMEDLFAFLFFLECLFFFLCLKHKMSSFFS